MSTTTNDDKRNKPLSKGELIIPCKNPMVREKVLDGSLEGWILHEIPRSQTRLDKYWYSPQKNKQFRSRIGVEKFIDILNEVGKDNEAIALKRFKLYQKEKKAKKGKKEKKAKKVYGSTAQTSKKKETIPIESAKKTIEEKKTLHSDVVAVVVGLTDEEWKELLENENDAMNENQKKRKSITISHPSTSLEKAQKIQKCEEAAMCHTQGVKKITMPPEERKRTPFAEAIISAVDEYELREAISKPDPFSAFHFSGDLVKPNKGDDGQHELSTITVPEITENKGCSSPSQPESLWL